MAMLLDYSLPELEERFAAMGEPAYRARQVYQWLWQKGVTDPQDMTNLAKSLRTRLAEEEPLALPAVVRVQESSDGTVKLLLSLSDGESVETVLIPEKDHYTLCLSTQVGCAMGCTFCATGTMGFTRQMTPGEILSQVLLARRILEERKSELALRNLVFMGMGEPLNNLHNVLASLETITHELGLGFSTRRVTVSTVGVPEKLERLGASGLASLAVSLHAPTHELRNELMPRAESLCPLPELMERLMAYPLKPRQRITFEYILLGGVNDSPAHARDLVRLFSTFRGSRPKVNLIAFNPPAEGPELAYRAPAPEDVEQFLEILRGKDVTVMLRKSKGQDIGAACGQLRAAHEFGSGA
ncbi:23S rRNA (adenine(2503)-C(2))-methyltransferase RlmN [Oceanidesulfovibrio indonesiensis]|uniref:Probable dual-specificity RNA methyltransferase RlmN n=1 Tax=Oceanidesulfovibrio indonesiensis TaxID=54767 RepID=A0A7M3MDB3_9BACT|nr:23S rRNA (adenine(2503)-C(2))-methyltransferase RlmN [Oceanidesulfovibrio indonesiensis]TVM16599.1 23S rRNA (adenine(2503)-C(2))-methyltransferase RlmN [Oceanidesulfovibrio indonesiensis]